MPALAAPVYPNRQSGLDSSRERWRRRAVISLQHDVPLDIVRQAYLYDLDRINKGGTPMSDRAAAVAIASAQGYGGETGRGTGNPVLGFAENAARDLRDIVLGLPRLPEFLLEEPARIGDPETGLGPSIAEGVSMLGEGDIKGLGRIAGAPGVRLIPGSFTLEMLGGGSGRPDMMEGGPGQLIEHPVFTFLDLLPIASKAGLTAKAVKGIKESGPYSRIKQSIENRGIGEKAKETARRFRQSQRSMEEGLLGEIPLGGGRMGTIDDLRKHMISWVEDFTDVEMRQTFDMLEEGRWKPGNAAPEWARNTGRGEKWTEMVTEADEMSLWYAEHGMKTGELVMVFDEIFPLTKEVRQILKELRQADEGKPSTVRKGESAASKEVRETGHADKWSERAAEVESKLSGVDPIAYSTSITELFET